MKLKITSVLAWAVAGPAFACDLCQISTPSLAGGIPERGLFGTVAEQFTHFGTLQDEGDEVANPFQQKLDSSITQLLAGYQFSDRFGLQFNLPVIHRSFQRVEDMQAVHGTESGIGDVSLLGRYLLWQKETEALTVNWNLYGGLKFPTGDSDRLGEEAEEGQGAGTEEELSGIHGHDLALGSGSWDGVVGSDIYARHLRFYLTAGLQYAIRSEGDFNYQYANDLTWKGGPGYYLVQNETWLLGVQAVVSGEAKGRDVIDGEKLSDTDVTSVFLGPQLSLTWKNSVSLEVAGDLPVSLDNGGLQAVPDYRIRGSLGFRF